MQEKIRIGIIGGGGIVEGNHLPVLLTRPSAQVEWGADLSAHLRQLLTKMYGVEVIDPTEGLAQKGCPDHRTWAVAAALRPSEV